MSDVISGELVAHLVDQRDVETFDVLGPRIEYLTRPDGNAPCLMRGTIPPGVSVPLHSHADPEMFVAVSGEIEGLVHSTEGFEWIRIEPGDVFHVPGGAKHAFRNRGQAPAVMFVISTSRIGRFFQEIGTPVVAGDRPSGPPAIAVIQRFLETAERYGYWNALPEENARIGISLPFG